VKGEDEPKAYSGALTADAIVSKMRHEVMSEPIPETQGNSFNYKTLIY